MYLFLSTDTGVRFSLNGTVYQNNSVVTLEEIGEDNDDALLCVTDYRNCCQSWPDLGNWYSPNGTRVPSSGNESDFYSTRGHMVVYLHGRTGRGQDGVYHCEIPDALNVTQTIYIGVYTPNSGE